MNRGVWDALPSLVESTTVLHMTGQPAFSLPCGWSSNGLPIGLQMVGPQAAEERLLSLAADFQDSSDVCEGPPCASWTDFGGRAGREAIP